MKRGWLVSLGAIIAMAALISMTSINVSAASWGPYYVGYSKVTASGSVYCSVNSYYKDLSGENIQGGDEVERKSRFVLKAPGSADDAYGWTFWNGFGNPKDTDTDTNKYRHTGGTWSGYLYTERTVYPPQTYQHSHRIRGTDWWGMYTTCEDTIDEDGIKV